MNMGEAIATVFKNYANFNGRSRRSEYWYFMLFEYLVLFVMGVIPIFWFIIPIWVLATLLPNISVTWRRLHDTGRSGAYWAFNLIPLVGTILLIVWCTEDSQPGDNIYGRNHMTAPAVGMSPAYTTPHRAVSPNNSFLGVQCISGPLQGQTYTVSTQGITFGTDVSNTVRIPAGTPGVSRMHCAIRWQQGVPVLIDLGSTYGTCMGDGKKLPPNYPERIAAGTRFYIGGWDVLFQVVNI